MNILSIFDYCVVERASQVVVLRYRSCISIKMPSLLRTKFEVEGGEGEKNE